MESKRSAELQKFQRALKKLLNKDVVDIILFGSLVKGGTPHDIDIAALFRSEPDREMKTRIKEALGREVDFQALTSDSIHSPIWLTLIKEGFSVRHGKSLAEIYHIQPVILFKFSLKKLSNVKKVQFSRGIKKVLGKEGNILTRSVVLVPIAISSEFQEFLRHWDIYYESQMYELLPVMRKETFL